MDRQCSHDDDEMIKCYVCYREILKVTKVSQLKFVVTEDLVQIGLSKPEQRRYKKIYSKYFPNPYISKIKRLLSSNKRNELVSITFVEYLIGTLLCCKTF